MTAQTRRREDGRLEGERPVRLLYHHRIAASDGMRVHVQELVGAFRSLGVEVLVVGPGGDENCVAAGGEPSRLERLSDLTRKLLPDALTEALEISYNLVAKARLERAVRAFRPDFIYERYNLYLLAGRAVARNARLPLALEINSPLAEEREKFSSLSLKRVARGCEDALWTSATIALPVTEVLAEKVRRVRGGDRRVEVVHNGSHADLKVAPEQVSALRAELGLKPTDLVLGFVGFVRDWHGVGWAMKLMPELGEIAHLVVVGDGPALPELKAAAVAAGLERRIHFVGAVPHHAVAGYVSLFDIALQIAAVAYASPLKIFDYMGLGRAIVAPDQPNIREILTDGEDALLFTAGDVESFRAAVIRLFDDASLRERLGRQARVHLIERRFTWKDNAARVLALLQDARAGGL